MLESTAKENLKVIQGVKTEYDLYTWDSAHLCRAKWYHRIIHFFIKGAIDGKILQAVKNTLQVMGADDKTLPNNVKDITPRLITGLSWNFKNQSNLNSQEENGEKIKTAVKSESTDAPKDTELGKDFNKKYIDVVIESGAYRILESSTKPKKHGSAISTLKKIEDVISKKLHYAKDCVDEYSELSDEELLKVFKEKSTAIVEGYKSKTSKLTWLRKKFSTQNKQVFKIFTAIENRIFPPKLLPSLHKDLIASVTKYLAPSDLAALAAMNRTGKKIAADAMVVKARELGYEGKDNGEAAQYLKDLYIEVEILSKMHLLPKKYILHITKGTKIAPYKTLQNLKNVSSEDLFNLLSNEKLYCEKFPKLRKVFKATGSGKISEKYSASIRAKGNAALILASRNGEKGIAELLLEHKIDPNVENERGSRPLYFAAQAGHANVVELLIKHGAKVKDLGAANASALCFACGYGNPNYCRPNIAVVELLLEHGADPNIPGRNGSSPLHFAAQRGHADIVEALLKHGAKVKDLGAGGHSALCFACGSGRATENKPNLAVVELLLEYGADPNIRAGNRSPPLHYAVQGGHVDIVKCLVNHGARINDPGWNGNTPLYFAFYTKSPNVAVIEFLLMNGADPHVPNINGETPAAKAQSLNRTDIIEILSKYF